MPRERMICVSHGLAGIDLADARLLFVMEVIVRLQVRALCASITCITGIMPSPEGWSDLRSPA
jgi:hypothetical protein